MMYAQGNFSQDINLHKILEASTIRPRRVGEVLLDDGLITSEQLQAALRHQKLSGQKIGHILRQHGAVSAYGLYQGIAKHFCQKALATVFTMVFGLSVCSTEATASSEQLILASMTATPGNLTKSFNYPSLFGTKERASSNLSAFTKWTGMLDRFETQLKNKASSRGVDGWLTFLERAENLSVREKITQVNSFFNDIKYVSDSRHWSASDFWATPVEFLESGAGDCEDYAIAKYVSLRALGVPQEQMRIVVVQDKIKNIPHAVLVVYAEGDMFVLDNQEKSVKSAYDVARYKPIFSINQQKWWLHQS